MNEVFEDQLKRLAFDQQIAHMYRQQELYKGPALDFKHYQQQEALRKQIYGHREGK